ncbi:MAG: PadR family transcriptional regulator [Candidatus Aminicenantes bacterium]|nr:PadR family transcriptional regulator [Candidatus Aminicenantes bacterium]
MKTPLYILGLLKRHGPQHGYQIRKNIAERVADFAYIKLPTIYYHLEQMEKKGLVSSTKSREGNRPERWVYDLTSAGEKELQKILRSFSGKEYRAEFDLDAVFFFLDFLPGRSQIIEALETQRSDLRALLANLAKHRREVSSHMSGKARSIALLLFSHHEKHYRAECSWLDEAILVLAEA